jgi:hypothetical protein
MKLPSPLKLWYSVRRFWLDHRFLVMISILGLGIVFLLISLFISPALPSVSKQLVQKVAENTLRPGDSLAALLAARGPATPVRSNDGVDEYNFSSQKNQNLVTKFWVANKKIIEIYYPITLEEDIKQTNPNFSPTSPYQEYWDSINEGEKIRLYVQDGLAIQFHNVTKTLRGIYVFSPNAATAFLNRHPEFAAAQPGQTGSVRTGEQWNGDIFAPATQ